jgi:hypothetical protein
LDDEREVTLAPGVWTTAGEITMDEGNKEELSHNLRVHRKQALINKLVIRVQVQAAKFLEKTFLELAPQQVVESFLGSDGGRLFLDWMEKSGVGFQQDGLKTVVTYKGRVINELVATIPLEHKSAVEQEIKNRQLVESIMES